MISARRFVCVFAGLFVLYAILRAHTLLSPVLHDEGLFLAGAQACATGELPYRDFWDHKPPGIFWLHSIPLRLFPFSRLAVKVSETFWIALSGTLFWFLCSRLFFRGVALATLALYVFYTSAPITIRSGGLTEELALTWHVLAYLLVMVPGKRGTRSSLLAGIALAVASQFRQTFVLSTPVFLWLIWRESQNDGFSPKASLKHLAVFVGGLAIPEMFVSFYFLCHGAWYTYFETSYWFNYLYVGAGGAPPVGRRTYSDTLRFIMSTGPYLVSPLLACGSIGRAPSASRRFLIPLLFLFAYDICGAEMSGEDYEHYYVQASVSSCLLIGFLLQSMVMVGERKLRTFLRRPDRIVLLLLCLVLCGIAVNRYAKDVGRLVQMQSRDRGPIVFQQSVAEAVQRLTDPEDRILLLGKSPNSVYLLGKRLPGSRYYHNAPLFKYKFRNLMPERFREEFLDDLRSRSPVIIILGAAEGESISRGMELVEKQAPFMLPALEKDYIPLEEVVEEIPPEWFWYPRFCSFLIRRDKAEEIAERLQVGRS
ncbi:MAG: glycosyltransferase family 39 protein [bacterium]